MMGRIAAKHGAGLHPSLLLRLPLALVVLALVACGDEGAGAPHGDGPPVRPGTSGPAQGGESSGASPAQSVAVATGPCEAGDERRCYAGPEALEELEVCHFGTQACEAGRWGPCTGWARPVNRVCSSTTANGGAPTPTSPGPGASIPSGSVSEGRSEGASSAPAASTPVASGPSSDPGPSDPGPSDPGASDPGASDPGASDPGPSDPGPSDPGASDPGPSDPGPSDPGPSDPDPSDPDPTELGPPQPGVYSYERLPIATFERAVAVDWHPSGEWALIAESNGVLHIVDRETLLVERSALSTTSNTTVHRLRFDPAGRAWVIGRRGMVGFIELVERTEEGEVLVSPAADMPTVQTWEDVAFDRPDGGAMLLAAGGGSGNWQFRLYAWSEEDGFTFELLRSSSAQCTRLGRVDTAEGEEGWMVACGPIGTPSIWYWTPHDGEARTGFGSTGNLSGVASHPSYEYALVISSSGRRVHRFRRETLDQGPNEPFWFSTRPIFAARFSPDGRRAGIHGQMTAAQGGLLLEYRHEFTSCPAPLSNCDINEVSVPDFDGPPWLGQGSATSFTDMAWHPECKGGLIVGGDAGDFGTPSRGLAVLFSLGDEKQACAWRDVRADFLAPPPDPGIDPEASPVAPSAYDWRRLALTGAGYLQSAAFSDDGAWGVLAERAGRVHLVDREDLSATMLTVPGGAGATLHRVRYGPDGRFWVLGERSGQGIVHWLERDGEAWRWVTPPALPGQQPYRAIRWETGDDTALLLASGEGNPTITRVERWDPVEEVFTLVTAFNAGHTCFDLARADNELGEKGWLMTCNTVLRYLTRVAGVYELRSGRMFGTTNFGNMTYVDAHPSFEVAFPVSWSGRRINRFERGRIVGTGVNWSNRAIRQLRFSPTGQRALVTGSAPNTPRNGLVKEFRFDAFGLSDIIAVGMPGIDQAPWNQGNGSRFEDVAWFPDCDGGVLVGGDNSAGLAALFERAGGVSCGLPD